MSKTIFGTDGSALQNSQFVADTCYFSIAGGPSSSGTGSNATTEAPTQAPYNSASTFSQWTATISDWVVGTPTFTFRKNTAAGNQTVSGGGVGVYTDATHTDSIASGDLIAGQKGNVSHGQNFRLGQVAVTADAGGGNSVTITGVWGGLTLSAASTTTYIPLCGGFFTATTEGTTRQTMLALVAGSFSNLNANVKTNTNANTATLTFRKNKADGNQAVSITAAATGQISDATHTDSVVGTDEVNTKIVTGLSTVSININGITSLFTSSGSATACYASWGGASSVLGNANYYGGLFAGWRADATANETKSYVGIQRALTSSFLTVGLVAGVACTGNARIGGVGGNQTVAVGTTSNTFYQDATHSDSVTAGSNCDTQMVGPASSNTNVNTFLMKIDTATVIASNQSNASVMMGF